MRHQITCLAALRTILAQQSLPQSLPLGARCRREGCIVVEQRIEPTPVEQPLPSVHPNLELYLSKLARLEQVLAEPEVAADSSCSARDQRLLSRSGGLIFRLTSRRSKPPPTKKAMRGARAWIETHQTLSIIVGGGLFVTRPERDGGSSLRTQTQALNAHCEEPAVFLHRAQVRGVRSCLV